MGLQFAHPPQYLGKTGSAAYLSDQLDLTNFNSYLQPRGHSSRDKINEKQKIPGLPPGLANLKKNRQKTSYLLWQARVLSLPS